MRFDQQMIQEIEAALPKHSRSGLEMVCTDFLAKSIVLAPHHLPKRNLNEGNRQFSRFRSLHSSNCFHILANQLLHQSLIKIAFQQKLKQQLPFVSFSALPLFISQTAPLSAFFPLASVLVVQLFPIILCASFLQLPSFVFPIQLLKLERQLKQQLEL